MTDTFDNVRTGDLSKLNAHLERRLEEMRQELAEHGVELPETQEEVGIEEIQEEAKRARAEAALHEPSEAADE